MTEAEWMACTEPGPMLGFLSGKASDRRFRLFAAACCRRIWHLMADRECRRAVEAAEGHADGLVTDKGLNRADAALTAKVVKERLAAWSTVDGYVRYMAIGAAQCAVKSHYLSYFAANSARYASQARSAFEGVEEGEAQSRLLRDIIGNPFRPVTIASACRTHEVTGLAQAIYDEGAFDRLHELADALQRASGCDNDTLLAHCHESGPHVRGCSAVDTVLGKL